MAVWFREVTGFTGKNISGGWPGLVAVSAVDVPDRAVSEEGEQAVKHRLNRNVTKCFIIDGVGKNKNSNIIFFRCYTD